MAGVDWIMADALGEEALNPGPFAMVQDNLAAWLRDPAGVRERDRGALDGLMRGLLMSGLAMQAHGNSRPASGSDHQFAHLWEMEELAVDGQPVSHGACVGIGCVSMMAAYEWLLHQDLSHDRSGAARRPGALGRGAESRDRGVFPAVFHGRQRRGRDGGQGVAGRSASRRRLRRLQGRLARDRRPTLHQRLPQAATVRRWLDTVGGAVQRRGASAFRAHKHAHDHARARLIRRRFTGLDVLHDLGWLDAAVCELFGAGGFWFNDGRKT